MTSALSIGLVIAAVVLVFVATSNAPKSRQQTDLKADPMPRRRIANRIRDRVAVQSKNRSKDDSSASVPPAKLSARDLAGFTWTTFR